jgi:hypothetical protein
VKSSRSGVLPDGPATLGHPTNEDLFVGTPGRAGVRTPFYLSWREGFDGPPVGRDLDFQVAVRCMLGDDGTHSLSTD